MKTQCEWLSAYVCQPQLGQQRVHRHVFRLRKRYAHLRHPKYLADIVTLNTTRPYVYLLMIAELRLSGVWQQNMLQVLWVDWKYWILVIYRTLMICVYIFYFSLYCICIFVRNKRNNNNNSMCQICFQRHHI